MSQIKFQNNWVFTMQKKSGVHTFANYSSEQGNVRNYIPQQMKVIFGNNYKLCRCAGLTTNLTPLAIHLKKDYVY